MLVVIEKVCGHVKPFVLHDGLLITYVRGKTDHRYRGGQLIWLMFHFEKATYSGGPYLMMAIEANLGSSYPQHEPLL